MRRSISGPSEFGRVYRAARRAGAPGLSVYVAPGPDPAGRARLGLVVKGKRAVMRNRIKRRIRAAFAAADPPSGLDLVVRGDARTLEMEFQEMVRVMEEAISLREAG